MDKKKYCTECGCILELYSLKGYKQCENNKCGKRYYDNPIVGVSVVHIKDGKVLLGKRNGSHEKGKWCVPCGYLENEEIKEGAAREFKEETNLGVTSLKLIDVISNIYHPTELIVSVYYEAKEVLGDLEALDDLDEVGYYDLDDLPEMAFTVDKIILKQLQEKGIG